MRTAIFLTSTLLLATACGTNAPGASAPGAALDPDADSELQATLREAGDARDDASNGGPSFADWEGRLDELLTLEMAAEAAGRPAPEAKTKYRPGGHTITFSWPTDRQREVMGMTLPASDQVGIGYMQTRTDEAFFRSRFAKTTDAQREQLEQEADRETAERGMDAASNQVAKDLLGELSKVHPIEEVDGVGDVAIWEMGELEQVLHVLVNGTSLQVKVDVGDPTRNRDASIALARRLVEQL